MRDSPFQSLGAELAREQDQALGDRRVSELELLRGMGRTRVRLAQRYRRIAIALVGLFVAATTTMATLAFKFPVVRYSVLPTGQRHPNGQIGGPAAEPQPMGRIEPGLSGQWIVASANEPRTIRFTDGSEAVLNPGARLRVTATTRRGATVNLESGSMGLRVAGTLLTEYWVSVGPFSLAIGNGRAVVSWDPMNELLDLVVHEGFVVISGCQFGSGRSVTADKELGTRCLTR